MTEIERDIVERLKSGEPCLEANGRPCRSMDAQSGCACAEAAAEITRLRNELHLANEWAANVYAGRDEDCAEITSIRTALAASEAKLVKARTVVEQMASFYTCGGGQLDFERAANILKEITDT